MENFNRKVQFSHSDDSTLLFVCIHSFIKYLLRAYYMLDIVPGLDGTTVNKTQMLLLRGSGSSMRQVRNR